MTRFTLLLFFIFPVLCFAQTDKASKSQISSGQSEDLTIYEYETKKAALEGLSMRELIELGYVDPKSLSTDTPEGYTGSGGSRAQCNEAYIPVDDTYTAVPRNDDGSLYIPNIGFTFSFCGTEYTDLYINTNGNLTFGEPLNQFSPDGFPYWLPIIAPFWADVDTRNTACGQAWYKLFPNYMIVSWEEVGWYNQQCNPLNTFQVIISDGTADIIGIGNNIQFRYGNMEWTTGQASGGGPFGGAPATVGFNSGDNENYEQVGRFNVNSNDYDGPFGNHDGVHWLDYKCFVFNSAGSSLELDCIDVVLSLDANCSLTITPEDVSNSNVEGCAGMILSLDKNTFTCADEGENIVTVTATSGPQSISCTAIVTITTDNCPAVSINQVGPLCQNDPVLTLTATPPGGTWGGAAPGGSFDPEAAGPGIHTITYQSDAGCPPTTTIEIEVYNSPDVTLTPIDAEFCEDEGSILLTANGSGGNGSLSYLWATPEGNATGPTYTAIFPGLHSVTVTDENGCEAVNSVEVFEYPNPDVIIIDPGPLCETTDIYTLTAAPSGGTWSGDIISPTGEVYPNLTGPGIYLVTYTYTNSFGCDGSDALSIEIISAPAAIPANSGPYCEGDQIFLFGNTNSQGGNIQYNWTGPTGYSSTEQNPTDATVGGMYILQVTVDGCPSQLEVTQVQVTPTPQAIALNEGPYCPGTPIQLIGVTPSPGNNISYEWVGPNGYFSSEQSPGNATDDGVYILTVTVDGCPSELATTEVVFITAPDALAANGGPYCEDETILLIGQTNTPGNNITYSWSGPNGYQSTEQNPVDATAPGFYFLTIDVDGCISELTSTEVVINNDPQPIISGSTSFCINGSSILNAGNYSFYEWSDQSSLQTLEVFTEGTYSVTVTDANGCTGTDDIFVELAESLNPVIIGDLEVCEGETSTLDAGSGFVTYLWSNDEITQTIEVSSAETYSVTVSDNSGCSGETSVSFVVNDNPFVIISGDEVFCDGNSSVLSAGNFPNYLWSDDTTDPTLEVFDSGTYSVTITDANGCTAEDDILITVNPNPVPVISGATAFCTGNSTTLDAGSDYSSYLWSSTETSQTITVSSPGTIVLTVTDSNGCSGETSVDIIENELPTPQIIGDLNICEGETSTLDAGDGFESYLWSNDEITQTIDVSSGGNWSVLVTDAYGCTGSGNVNLTVFTNPTPTIGGSTTYCVGGSTVLNAGAGYDSYLWNTTENTQSISASSPGIYTVEVIDQNGCSGTAMVDVEESTSLNPVISGGFVFCEDGSTILDAGDGFDAYLWSDTSSGQTLEVEVEGTYSLTVSDGQGCTGETSVDVQEVAPPFADLITSISVCNTDAGGSILNLYDLIQGGDANGNWEDADNSGAVGLFNNLNFDQIPAGDYNFIYTTNSAVAPCPETVYDVLVTVIDCSCPDVVFFEADPLCNGGQTLDLSTIENTPETGSWSIAQTPPGLNPATINGSNFDASDADPGEYLLQFELTNQPPPGCAVDYFTSITVEEGVDAGVADLPFDVCYDDDEIVTLSGLIIGGESGGNWTETSNFPSQGNAFDPVNGTFSTSGQFPGSYTFQYTVSSFSACPDDFEEVIVVVNELPVVEAGNGVEINCFDPTLSLDANSSSSGAQFDISWSGPGIVIDGNENTLTPTVDQSGFYTLTITNNLTGCIAIDQVEVVANFDSPLAIAGSDEYITCDAPDATIQVLGDIGPGFEVTWQGPGINDSNMNLSNPTVDLAGIYTATIQDLSNGCISDEIALEVFNETQLPDVFVQIPLEDLDCNTSSLGLTGGSLDNDVSFQWIFNGNVIGNNPVLTGITEPGIYSLVVTNNQTGCTDSEAVEVFQNEDYPVAEAGNPQHLNCYVTETILDGSNSDGGNDIVYQWSGPAGGISGSTTQNIANVILPGTYTLSVENLANGCVSTDVVTVTQDIQPPDVVIGDVDELDCSTFEVTLDGSQSSPGNIFSYTWTDDSGNILSNSQNMIATNPGAYHLTVLNTENGCEESETAVVTQTENVPQAAVLNVEDPSCFGDSDGYIIIEQVLGGIEPYVFSINDEPFSSNNFYNNLSPGTYDVALEDANGCIWDTTVVIATPIQIDLNLGLDIEVEMGEPAHVQALINIPPNQIDTFFWRPAGLVICEDLLCFEGIVNTFNTMSISATVVDENGCIASDEVMIEVNKDRRVYIPTAFTPNGDGDNDVFFIHADARQVAKVNKFAIFNRWGDAVFEANNFLPNDPDFGWDGTFKSKRLDPSVFVYFAEIVFIDGHVEMYKGDITLLK